MERSQRSERLSQAARTTLSSCGLRSPSSHGVNSRPSQPAGARARPGGAGPRRTAPATPPPPRSAPMPLPPPSSPSLGATICSRSQRSAAPPVSWLLATMGKPGSSPGSVAIWWKMSVRLNGTRALSHDVVEMATCVSYGATAPEPTMAACMSGTPHITGAPGATPRSPATSGRSGPSTDPVGSSSGRRVAVAARARDQRVHVAGGRAGAVVGEPPAHDGGRRRGGPAGEAEPEVVHRLQQDPGPGVHLGQTVLQQQRVPGGVGAAGRGSAAGEPHERQHLLRREARHRDRPADDRPGQVAGAGVGPQQDVAGGPSVGADRHRRGPLAGDGHGVQPVRGGAGRGDGLTRRVQQLVPPLDGVLRGQAVAAHLDLHAADGRAQDGAVERAHGDLGAAVAEVDGEDPAVAHDQDAGVAASPAPDPASATSGVSWKASSTRTMVNFTMSCASW